MSRRNAIQAQSDQLMTAAEIADMFRCSKMTVYRMINGGELPAVRIGRSFRVYRSVVKQHLRNSAIPPQRKRK
jgi:excisionase family DNA binding protein